ncbi:MAG: 50S ribosomal protein L18 [Candidatus Aureabacteria bacterium]|nr:50S ribosomal protein L18 [Candidatus Auribacterota bacterium]
MIKKMSNNKARLKRHIRTIKRMKGTVSLPRLSIFRSLKNLYVQVIDDETGRTLVSASTLSKADKKSSSNKEKTSEQAKILGKRLAESCLEKGIQSVIFCRSGYKYHGRIKALADSAREAGLKF